MNEEQIILGIKQYDERVINFLYQDCFDSVTSFIQSRGAEISQSHDIFQDSIMALVKNVQNDSFKGDSKIKSYLTSIAKYKLYNSLKKKGKVLLVEEFPEHIKAISDDSSFKEDEVDLIIQKELSNLTEECKKLIVENVYRDIPLKKVAELLKLTYDFVRQKKRRCLNQLKTHLLKNSKINEIYG